MRPNTRAQSLDGVNWRTVGVRGGAFNKLCDGGLASAAGTRGR